ncbi:MAG: AAA family ATPase [Myxococcales bacterium]|nr:AAA family ATPase [Myxococcales bacterium]
MDIEPLPATLVADLERPEAYPDDETASQGVETIQTHISHVFLTRARVVKLRKALRLSFLDFSTRAQRIADCHHEVALNRRLAPDVYLGAAPVEFESGHFRVRDCWAADSGHVDPDDPREFVVVMRRLESDRDALSLLEQGALHPTQLDAVARTLAQFHDGAGLGCPAPWSPEAWWQHCFEPVENTLSSLRSTASGAADLAEIEALESALQEAFEQRRRPLEVRRKEGRAVDGHGDLHLQHIWFERDAKDPIIIDCLEFDPNLRRIDTANEVAFLAMDLSYRGRTDLAARFLRRYATARDDFGLYEVVDAFQGYRAAVRAKVAALAARDSAIEVEQQRAAFESMRRHLALAGRSIRGPGKAAVVLVCGTVGVGKSGVAEAIADRTEGVVISSDRTRKRMAGVAAEEHPRSAPDEGLYSAENTRKVYEGLLERAGPVVSSGRLAILDATFSSRAARADARRWAERRGVDALLVHVDCAEEEVRARVAERSARGTDPSDAGPDFIPISRARFEAPTEWPESDRFVVRTDREGWESAPLEPLSARLGHP